MKKKKEFLFQVNSSRKLFQQLRVGVKRLCRVISRVLGKGATTVEQFASTSNRIFFNSFAPTDKSKNITDGTILATGSYVV